jgi:phosphate-selective porin OprO/OprP
MVCGIAGSHPRRPGASPLALVVLLLVAQAGHAQPPADVGPPEPEPAATASESPSFPNTGLDVLSYDDPNRKPPAPLQVTWDYGLRFVSPDDQYHVHVGGIAQLDTVWLIGPQSVFAIPGGGSNGVGNAQASQLRRTILQVNGDFLQQFDFFVQLDFANASNDNSGLQPPSFGNLTSSPAPLNIWMQVRDVPVLGHIRIGNQVKPLGMDNNTSAAVLPFLERSDNMDAFYGPFDNGFALGVSAINWTADERITWRYGIFQPATNVFGTALNKYTAGARVTALPWYADEGRELVHLGLGYWGGEIVMDQLEVRARTLLRNGPGFAVPILVNTGEIPGSKQYTIAPEFAVVWGSFTFQAEWAGQFLTEAIASNGKPQGTVFYNGGYLEALYFLTGEYQHYVRTEGTFGRVLPRDDYHLRKGDDYRGRGAWQVGVRFSYLNLNDGAIHGGDVYDWTVGLNWFLNPNMKLQLNYILEHRDAPQGVAQGWINGVGLRAAYDF